MQSHCDYSANDVRFIYRVVEPITLITDEVIHTVNNIDLFDPYS